MIQKQGDIVKLVFQQSVAAGPLQTPPQQYPLRWGGEDGCTALLVVREAGCLKFYRRFHSLQVYSVITDSAWWSRAACKAAWCSSSSNSGNCNSRSRGSGSSQPLLRQLPAAGLGRLLEARLC